MSKEYLSRIMDESGRPELSPDGFRQYLAQLEEELQPQFIEIARDLSDKGEAEILLALSELSQRLRIMGSYLNPRIAPHNVNNLFSTIDIARGLPVKRLASSEEVDLDVLRNAIVHSADPIKRNMFNYRLILPAGKRLLKKLDRTSPYYRLPEIDINIEMEEIENA